MNDELTDHRAQRGFVLAADKGAKIRTILKGKYLVPSGSKATGSYFVGLQPETCSCPDHEETTKRCKHIWAALVVSGALEKRNMSNPKKKTYGQNWPAYRASRLEERPTFERLLRELCRGIPEPVAKETGRPRLPLADVIYAAVLRSYTTFSGDRAHGDVMGALKNGYISHAPHPNTVFRILRHPETVGILMGLIEESSRPLRDFEENFAIDSSGFPISKYANWFEHKHKGKKKPKEGEEPLSPPETDPEDPEHRSRQLWVKLHIMVGVRTQIITSVVTTTGNRNDCPFLPGLVKATGKNFTMKLVAADKGYVSEENILAIIGAGAEARIAFKSNNVPQAPTKKDPHAHSKWNRLLALYTLERETFLKTYHVRSLSETVFSQLKRVLGSLLRAKTAEGQIAEALLRVLAHNIRMLVQSIHELGIEPRFWPKLEKAS